MVVQYIVFDKNCYRGLSEFQLAVNSWLKEHSDSLLQQEIGKSFAVFLYDSTDEVTALPARRIRNGSEARQQASRVFESLEGLDGPQRAQAADSSESPTGQRTMGGQVIHGSRIP